MSGRLRVAMSVVLLASAGVQGARGAWIYVKAEVAQVLLERAWARVLSGAAEPKPWPWADAWPVARLSLPGGDHIVLAGASGRNLAFAPGHLDGSAAPGAEGTCVIAGHRDTHFAELERLVPGDRAVLQDPSGRSLAYRVAAMAVVDQDDVWVLSESNRPTLVLVTCWPFDAVAPGGRERYVVWAQAVSR
jgi:sortase A